MRRVLVAVLDDGESIDDLVEFGPLVASDRSVASRKELEAGVGVHPSVDGSGSEASSLAFFVLMGLAITYGFAESFLEISAPSPWIFAGAGGFAHAGAKAVLGRKYL